MYSPAVPCPRHTHRTAPKASPAVIHRPLRTAAARNPPAAARRETSRSTAMSTPITASVLAQAQVTAAPGSTWPRGAAAGWPGRRSAGSTCFPVRR